MSCVERNQRWRWGKVYSARILRRSRRRRSGRSRTRGARERAAQTRRLVGGSAHSVLARGCGWAGRTGTGPSEAAPFYNARMPCRGRKASAELAGSGPAACLRVPPRNPFGSFENFRPLFPSTQCITNSFEIRLGLPSGPPAQTSVNQALSRPHLVLIDPPRLLLALQIT